MNAAILATLQTVYASIDLMADGSLEDMMVRHPMESRTLYLQLKAVVGMLRNTPHKSERKQAKLLLAGMHAALHQQNYVWIKHSVFACIGQYHCHTS
jgi:hypothetical protein